MDKLSNGDIIPLLGNFWDRYYYKNNDHSSPPTIPVSIAKFCVLEGIIKTIMAGNYNEQDPYKDKQPPPQTKPIESIRDKLLLQMLINVREIFKAY